MLRETLNSNLINDSVVLTHKDGVQCGQGRMLVGSLVARFEAEHVLLRLRALIVVRFGRPRQQLFAISAHSDVHSASRSSVGPQRSGLILHATVDHRAIDVRSDLVHLLAWACSYDTPISPMVQGNKRSLTKSTLRTLGCANEIHAVLFVFGIEGIFIRDPDRVTLWVVIRAERTALNHFAFLCSQTLVSTKYQSGAIIQLTHLFASWA